MPSFTRRASVRTGGARAFAGTNPTAATPSARVASSSTTPAAALPPTPAPPASISTGIGSLDDVLGFLSPGSTLLLLAPDAHTAWSRLVARHVAAQGLLEGGRVLVASGDPASWVKGMVWVAEGAESEKEDDDKEKDKEQAEAEKDANERGYADRRIAWRYDALTFQTTVGTTALDASKTLPPAVRTRAEAERRLVQIAFDSDDGGMHCLCAIASALDELPSDTAASRVAVEISPEQEFSPSSLVRFLLALRALMRARGAVGVITLPPRLSSASSSSPEWISTLAHSADATLTLAGFGTNPLASAYAPAHGLLTVHSLPVRGHVLAPALRHSTLLGVSSGSEQNLGFRLKRKRWVVETVHLGIEGGGSGERRTEPVRKVVHEHQAAATAVVAEGVEPAHPAATSAAPEVVLPPKADKQDKTEVKKEKKPRARVRFGDDIVVSHDAGAAVHSLAHSDSCSHAPAKPAAAPKIAIRHDRPDLYEF